jgi:glycosyltransferase involved in cell wall biosynthesis
MKKALLITDVTFWEKCSGHRMRISALIEYLQFHVQLTVVITGPAPGNVETSLREIYNANFHILEKEKYLDSNGYGRRLKAFLKDKQFDTIIIEYIHSSYFLNFLIDDAHVILDAHDIISERTTAFREFNYPGALYEMSIETESEIFKIYDNVMLLCKPDYKKVKPIIGAHKALLCPHPVTISRHTLRKEVKNITFIASAYLPNRDAINFFIANCWPQISSKYAVCLSIYGTVCYDKPLIEMDRVTCKGFEADLNKIYEEADIIINPVRFGAGLKIKNIEALANGIPLVTTTHGARGLEAIKNKGFLIANDADDFIKVISSLIDDFQLRQELSRCAHNYIQKNFSAEKCFAPLLKVIY